MPLAWAKCPLSQTSLWGLKQEKVEEADTVTLIKQLKIIIIITYHPQGRVLTIKHIESKNICYVRLVQGKSKTTPPQKNLQLGQEFNIVNSVAQHSTPLLSSSLFTLWGWDPLYEHCKTPGCKTIKAHWRKHSHSLLCPQSHTHTMATQWFCCF